MKLTITQFLFFFLFFITGTSAQTEMEANAKSNNDLNMDFSVNTRENYVKKMHAIANKENQINSTLIIVNNQQYSFEKFDTLVNSKSVTSINILKNVEEIKKYTSNEKIKVVILMTTKN
jgi:hypothetical protein